MSRPWAEAYADRWPQANRRVASVELLFEQWGFEVERSGFMTGSNEYVRAHPPEKGMPKPTIKKDGKVLCLIQVTGTYTKEDTIWIRPDKVQYTLNHPDLPVYIAYLIDETVEIFFFAADKAKVQVIHPTTKAGEENVCRTADATHRGKVPPETSRNGEWIDEIDIARPR